MSGEHECVVDREESASHVDGTDGRCLLCGQCDLL